MLLGADAVVAQGNEAGGHGAVSGASLMTLLPEIIDRVAAASDRAGLEQPVPVLAAGAPRVASVTVVPVFQSCSSSARRCAPAAQGESLMGAR